MNIETDRANPFKNLTNEEIERQLQILCNEFGKDWINNNEGHPLQILWKRKDQISTLELLTLSKAVERITKIDGRWFQRQKRVIMGHNINNRKGAFWEIIGAYYLMSPKNRVIPAPESQKGFDLSSTIVETGKRINYSLKFYSFSKHYNTFMEKCRSITTYIRKRLKENKISTLQAIIGKFKTYPTETEWEELDVIIEKIMSDIKTERFELGISYKDWNIGFLNMPEEVENHKLSNKFNSYTILIHVPYHKNEERNLLSNIQDAISNLKNSNIKEDKNSINALFIHIPTTASIIQCWDWISEYYKQISENPITRLILYQPSINFDFKTKTTYLQYCMRVTDNADRFDPWFDNDIRNNPEFWFETGIFNPKPFVLKIIFDGQAHSFKNIYSYQTGNIFLEPKELGKGKSLARFGKHSSGIHIHTVFKGKIITTPMEPEDELLIL